jgi:hypothetical protein
MFTKPIFTTTLTGETADRLFANVTSNNTPDKSFLATMRALSHKRTQDNVRLTCLGLYFSEAEISTATTATAMGWFSPGYSPSFEESVTIIYTDTPSAGAKMLEIVRANAGKDKRYLKNYSICEDLRIFYARKLNALFYYSETDRDMVIFTDKLELKQFHALQMMIPKYLPELFKDSPLTESETKLLKSYGNKTAAEYERLIEEFAHSLDIRAEIIRSKLAGFETAFERQRLDEIKNEISMCESNYQNALSNLRDIAARIQEKQYILAGLECAITKTDGDTELMDYFMCNKRLSIIKVSGTAIEFVVHGYADVFDEEAFEQYVKNHKSYMYTRISPRVTKPQMEKLYRAIFGEGKYKLRLCAAYNADMKGGLKAMKHYTFPPESKTYLENPHIQQFGCIGGYAARFQEYMRKKDYVGAIDQAVVSAKNLNFYDSAVIGTFASQLSGTSTTCIEKPDGTLITPFDAIQCLLAEDIKLERGNEPCQDQ